MAELINNAGYQDFTLETLQTPDGISRFNGIIRQLAQNISSDGESVRIYQGYGTPEASVAAGVGSLYMRVDGGADTSVYRKESGSADTGWVAIKAPASLPLSTANGGLGVDASSWTAGDILFLSSTGVISHRSPNVVVFTASGTFVAPSGITKVYLSMVGAGAGAGAQNTGISAVGGGGGGGGASVINYPYTVVAGNSYTITIGAGGQGGQSNGADGVNGGNTIFDVSGGAFTVTGGTKGFGAGTAGAGGTGTSANASTTTGGGPVKTAGGTPAANSGQNGGGGGGSIFGTGGNGATSGNGNNGSGFGGGGGGGFQSTGNKGGNGTDGICLIIF